MSPSGMSSGPHGETSDPSHVFSSVNASNEVCYKSCSLHKSIYSALQRDHCVCFVSHSGSPADPVLCYVNCPGNSPQFCGGDSWYTFHLTYLWVAPVDSICSGMRSQLETTCQVHDSLFRLFQRDCSLHPACTPADSILRAMYLSVILS